VEPSVISARVGIAGVVVAAPALQFEQIENAARGPTIMKGYEAAFGLSQTLLRTRFAYRNTTSQKPAVPAINASMPAK
jgi:hypothetical protein